MATEDRYDKLTLKTLPNGKTVYSFAMLKTVSVDTNTAQQVLPGDGDRMDIMAHNAYGNAESWWKIAAANKQVNGSLFAKPGQVLYIPDK